MKVEASRVLEKVCQLNGHHNTLNRQVDVVDGKSKSCMLKVHHCFEATSM